MGLHLRKEVLKAPLPSFCSQQWAIHTVGIWMLIRGTSLSLPLSLSMSVMKHSLYLYLYYNNLHRFVAWLIKCHSCLPDGPLHRHVCAPRAVAVFAIKGAMLDNPSYLWNWSQTQYFNTTEWNATDLKWSRHRHFFPRWDDNTFVFINLCHLCCDNVVSSVHWNCLSDSGTISPYHKALITFLIFLSRCQI